MKEQEQEVVDDCACGGRMVELEGPAKPRVISRERERKTAISPHTLVDLSDTTPSSPLSFQHTEETKQDFGGMSSSSSLRTFQKQPQPAQITPQPVCEHICETIRPEQNDKQFAKLCKVLVSAELTQCKMAKCKNALACLCLLIFLHSKFFPL